MKTLRQTDTATKDRQVSSREAVEIAIARSKIEREVTWEGTVRRSSVKIPAWVVQADQEEAATNSD